MIAVQSNHIKPMVQADQNDIRGSSFSIATTALAMGLVSQPTSQAGSRVGSPVESPATTPGTPDSDRSSVSIDERYRTSTFKSQLTVESRDSRRVKFAESRKQVLKRSRSVTV